MATLTLTDARNLVLKGRPWTFRLENTSNGHNKFWLATGRKPNEPVEIHYGAIGSAGTILVKDWAYVERTAPEKVAKGYVYADTPFVRVQQSTIAAFMQAAGTVAPPPSPPPPPVAPPPVVPAPVAPVSNLPGPWGRIATVQRLSTGSWVGLNSAGGKVLDMTRDGARNLVQGYPHIHVVGL